MAQPYTYFCMYSWQSLKSELWTVTLTLRLAIPEALGHQEQGFLYLAQLPGVSVHQVSGEIECVVC